MLKPALFIFLATRAAEQTVNIDIDRQFYYLMNLQTVAYLHIRLTEQHYNSLGLMFLATRQMYVQYSLYF